MTATFMLDTNIMVYIRTGRLKSVEDRFRALPPGNAVMSVVTYGELLHGAQKSVARDRALSRLSQMIEIVGVAPMPVAAGREYGVIRADSERRGQIIGPNDLWIAAHARASDLTLVTRDEREFRRVPGLKTENWAA